MGGKAVGLGPNKLRAPGSVREARRMYMYSCDGEVQSDSVHINYALLDLAGDRVPPWGTLPGGRADRYSRRRGDGVARREGNA